MDYYFKFGLKEFWQRIYSKVLLLLDESLKERISMDIIFIVRTLEHFPEIFWSAKDPATGRVDRSFLIAPKKST